VNKQVIELTKQFLTASQNLERLRGERADYRNEKQAAEARLATVETQIAEQQLIVEQRCAELAAAIMPKV
jgi:recombinational DNA repair ATPase RecF